MKIKVILVLFFLPFLAGCVATTANVTNFPKSNSIIDFDEISKRDLNPDDPIWNLKGRSEYMIKVKADDEKILFELLIKANIKQGYSINYSNLEDKVIIRKRGMRMNEWNSVSGVYFRNQENIYQVYIRVDITQDITGGWKENRAKKIADAICNLSQRCL